MRISALLCLAGVAYNRVSVLSLMTTDVSRRAGTKISECFYRTINSKIYWKQLPKIKPWKHPDKNHASTSSSLRLLLRSTSDNMTNSWKIAKTSVHQYSFVSGLRSQVTKEMWGRRVPPPPYCNAGHPVLASDSSLPKENCFVVGHKWCVLRFSTCLGDQSDWVIELAVTSTDEKPILRMHLFRIQSQF